MSHYSPSYAITIRVRYPDESGRLGHITTEIGAAQGMIGAVDIVNVRDGLITRLHHPKRLRPARGKGGCEGSFRIHSKNECCPSAAKTGVSNRVTNQVSRLRIR